MFSFLNKLEVCYCNIAQCRTKTVGGCTFYDKILDNTVFIEASQTWRLEYFSILNENTFIQNTEILHQWPEISYKKVKISKFLRGKKYSLLLQILMKPLLHLFLGSKDGRCG